MSALTSSEQAEGTPGPYERVAELHVLRLKGSFYEMGRQHGELLASEIPLGPLPYYRTYLNKLMGRSIGPLSSLVWPLTQRLIGGRVAEKLPDFVVETLKGLADGAGMPFDVMLEGATMPDSLLWVASKLMRLQRVGPAVHHRLALGLGCTSAIAWGDATSDGMLLHGRNLDYHGVASWPRTAAVVFHEPDDGHRYVSVAAAGVPLGGVTAMNAAGLTLTVHQHMFTDRTRLGGIPIGVVGDIVMRQASTLDEAEAILGAHTPIGCWTYLITDGKRREVLCWEENPDRKAPMRVRGAPGTFGYANIYLDQALGETEADLYPSYWRANLGRHQQVRSRLADEAGTIDADRIASMLADIGSGPCRLRDSIANLMTVASVVFRPEDGVLWVASGEAPTSQRTFIPFDLERMGPAPEHGTLSGGHAQDPVAAQAFEAYRSAYLAYIDGDDPAGSQRLMDTAIALQPEQSLYHCIAGLIALKEGAADRAVSAFDAAVGHGHTDDERVASFHLWRGRAYDLSGRRDRARSDYRAVLGQRADDRVRGAAHRGLRRAYTQRRAARIDVDFMFADVVTP